MVKVIFFDFSGAEIKEFSKDFEHPRDVPDVFKFPFIPYSSDGVSGSDLILYYRTFSNSFSYRDGCLVFRENFPPEISEI